MNQIKNHFSFVGVFAVFLVLGTGGCNSSSTDPEAAPGMANTSQFDAPQPEIGLPSAADLDRLGTKNDLDTVGLLDDSLNVMLVQPQRFLGSSFGKGNADMMGIALLQLVKTPLAFDKLERIIVSFRQPIGVPVQQMGPDGKPVLTMMPMTAKSTVLLLAEPTTPEKFFAETLQLPPQVTFDKLVKNKVGDREYYDYIASSGAQSPVTIAVHFADERKVVIIEGDHLTIANALNGVPARGAAMDRLGRIDLKNTDLAMIVSREGASLPGEEIRLFLNMMQFPAPVVEAMMYARSLSAQLDSHAADDAPLFRVSIDTTEAKGVRELSEQIQAWILSGQVALASHTAATPQNMPMPPEIARELLDALSVETKDSIVQVALKSTPALKQRYADLIRGLRQVRHIGEIQGRIGHIAQGIGRYFEANKTFPPRSTLSADGKPLLSWRVVILPLIGQEELYKQFKLDEPWDSPHNKPLVEKMPPFYAIPEADSNTEQAPTKTRFRIFNSEGTPFAKKDLKPEDVVSPYTTAMVVVVAPDQAVEWTRPDTLEYKPEPPDALKKSLKTLFGETLFMLTAAGEFVPVPIDQVPVEMLDTWITGKMPPQPAEQTPQQSGEQTPQPPGAVPLKPRDGQTGAATVRERFLADQPVAHASRSDPGFLE